MSKWLRKHGRDLSIVATQAGLTPEEAERALMIGARFVAHGFTQGDIDSMVQWKYRGWAEDFASDDVSAKLRHFRRWGQ